MALTAYIDRNLKVTQTNNVTVQQGQDIRPRTVDLHLSPRKVENGTGDGQATLLFHDTIAFESGTGQDLDLDNLTDPQLGTISFALVKFIRVVPHGADGEEAVLGGAATNPWEGANTPFRATDSTLAVRSGAEGLVLQDWEQGYTVGASSKILTVVTNFTGNVSITILGD